MAGLDFLLGAQGDDQNAARMGLLAAGLGMLGNNTGHYGAFGPAAAAGGMAGLQAYHGAQEAQMQEQYKRAQMAELQRKQQAAQAQQQALSAVASGGTMDPRQLLAAGVPAETVKAMFESGDWGRAKIKDWQEVRQADGTVKKIGYDEFGRQVGDGVTPYHAPVFQDLGGRVVALDPTNLSQLGGFGKTMTPGEAASNAIAGANLGLSRERLALEKQAAGGPANNPMYKGAPSGYRWNMQGGLEAIPGGPAGEGKAPTEFEAKSRIFGNRAESSGKTFNTVEKDYSPTAIAAAQAAANAPLGLGGVAGTAANASLRDVDQKAMQAKRNWIAASLRLESGAVIGPSEFTMQDKTFFPQPGDSATVIAQKRAARAQVEQELKAAGGQRKPTAAPAPASPAQAPAGWSITPVAPAANGWSIKKVN